MLKASKTAPLAQDGRSPLSNPCSPISALVYIGCAAALGRRFPLYLLISGQRS